MSGFDGLELLFKHASAYKFDEFDEAFDEISPDFSREELGEALAMRAQIKLFACDITFMYDMLRAEEFGASPRFPCLNDSWRCDSPNRFVVASDAEGALRDFLEILPRAEEVMNRLYGESGATMVRQTESEILYFSGRFVDALRLAELTASGKRGRGADVLLSLFVQFRCNLALGLLERAEECMIEMVKLSRIHPECIVAYLVIRDWANITTGWSGDTPRFFDAPRSGGLAVLEDRLTAIRNGISRLSPLEKRFVEYASRAYPGACTMRRHYMNIFHAIYWFQARDAGQSEEHFMAAYRMSEASGLVMPFVEYGAQIVPLLRHADEEGACSKDWTVKVLPLAERYEECLQAYRG